LEHCEPADPDEEIGSTTQEGAPRLETSESDSARDFLLYVDAHLYNNFFGTEDQAGLTVAVHVAWAIAGRAAGALLPGPGW